jgi:GTP cyclohydrolase I
MTIEAVKTPVNINVLQEAGDASRPGKEEVEEAVRTLLRYIGEDPQREGLRETPERVVRACEEFFAGYKIDPEEVLGKTFEDIAGYDDIVTVKNIDFVSHCEHHIVPIIGKAHVAYWPSKRVVGISKLARVVDIFAKRLVSQENLTREIAETIDRVLTPMGVAVVIGAEHQCMSTRGVYKQEAVTVTSHYTGIFNESPETRQRFLDQIKS